MPVLLEHRDPPPLERLATHPVLELMRERKKQGSLPGTRKDDAVVAVAIEGGGMRGMVSAGMAAGLELLGLRDSIDLVVGSSAGSLNGAFLIAGQAQWGCSIYYNDLLTRRFINYSRAFSRRPIVDMNYVVHWVYVDKRPLDYWGIVRSPIALHCLATNVDRAEIDVLKDFNRPSEVQMALLASTRIPGLAGPPVEIGSQRYLDATLAESIPITSAIAAGATHILTLQTRPYGQRLTGARKSDRFISAYLGRLSPQLQRLHAGRPQRYAAALNLIDQKAADFSLNPAICPIRPLAGTPTLSQLEQSRSKVVAGACSGLKAMFDAFTGEPHVAQELLVPIPQRSFDRWRAGAQ